MSEEVKHLRQMQEDYRKVFLGSKAGKRVLADLLAYAGVLAPSMTGNSQTFFREGQRDVGIKILTALDRRSYAGLEELEKEGIGLTEIFGKE